MFFASSLAAVGCGTSPGTVSGTVYHKDKILKGGTVTFLTADKQVSRLAKIGEDGSYTIDNMPVGAAKIGVETTSVQKAASVPRNVPTSGTNPNSPQDPKAMANRYVPIPVKYADPTTSGLEYTVRGGKQPYDIKLP